MTARQSAAVMGRSDHDFATVAHTRAYRTVRFLIVVVLTIVAVPVALALLVAKLGERGR